MAILRKIKEKIKSVVAKKRKIKAIAPRPEKKPVKQAPPLQKQEKQVIGAQEMFVEKTKFYSPVAEKISKVMPQELSVNYGQDRMVLQVRDTHWMHTYWEVTHQTWEDLKQRLGGVFYSAKKVLRAYDVTQVIFNGKNAHKFFDIEVGLDTNNWYIDAGQAGRSWCVDLGLRLVNGEFITILRSNVVTTPSDSPSHITDEEWMIPEELFSRLYGMGFGFGRTSPIGKAWQERIRQALFSGALASPGMASMASPVKLPKERKFRLVVDCELIVYGATEPDAKVTVQDKPIKLRPDGTFTLRFALPDGKHVIPVKAVSSDQIEERTITPIVSRQTTSSEIVKEVIK